MLKWLWHILNKKYQEKSFVPVLDKKELKARVFDEIPQVSGPSGHMFSTHNMSSGGDIPVELSIQRGVKDFVDGQSAMDAVATMDSCSPCDTNYGGFDNAFNPIFSWYASQGFIGYQMCAMMMQNWAINKACTMPAEDAVRKGYKITVNSDQEIDPDILDDILTTDQKVYDINAQMIEYVRSGRVFGVRVAIYEMTDEFLSKPGNEDYYQNPFNLDSITPGSYKGIVQVDPQWTAPILNQMASSDPSSRYYFEPTFWNIAGFKSIGKIHRSHLCIMRHVEVPDLLKPSYFFGGIPLPQLIYERNYAAERLANEMPMLALTKRLTTWKIDQTKVLANSASFESKMRQNVQNRNNFGFQTIGMDDDLVQHDTSLNDLEPLVMASYKLCAAIAVIPFDKFIGESPGGLGASKAGQYDESSYHESLESIQQTHLDPLLCGHHQRMIRSYIMPKYGISQPFDVTVVFHALDALTEKEQAEINEIKARTASTLIQSGAIDSEFERQRLIHDKDSGYEGIEVEKDGFEEEDVSDILGEEEDIFE